jgi:hypothetical protein
LRKHQVTQAELFLELGAVQLDQMFGFQELLFAFTRWHRQLCSFPSVLIEYDDSLPGPDNAGRIDARHRSEAVM